MNRNSYELFLTKEKMEEEEFGQKIPRQLKVSNHDLVLKNKDSRKHSAPIFVSNCSLCAQGRSGMTFVLPEIVRKRNHKTFGYISAEKFVRWAVERNGS